MKKSRLRDNLESLLLVIFIALLVRNFILYPYRVEDSEMSPTLRAGDFIWSYSLAFGLKNPFNSEKRWAARNPERNELVIFENPHDPGELLARRVHAIEGDKVEGKSSESLIIPPGYFFAKADNNAVRGVGLVPLKQLRGKIWLIWFSLKSKNERSSGSSINWKRLFKAVN